MKHFKEKLEIETLKSLTYTQINELLNKLTLENTELTKQLSLYGVSQRSELLKGFANYLQSDVGNLNYDFTELVEDYEKTL